MLFTEFLYHLIFHKGMVDLSYRSVFVTLLKLVLQMLGLMALPKFSLAANLIIIFLSGHKSIIQCEFCLVFMKYSILTNYIMHTIPLTCTVIGSGCS